MCLYVCVCVWNEPVVSAYLDFVPPTATPLPLPSHPYHAPVTPLHLKSHQTQKSLRLPSVTPNPATPTLPLRPGLRSPWTPTNTPVPATCLQNPGQQPPSQDWLNSCLGHPTHSPLPPTLTLAPHPQAQVSPLLLQNPQEETGEPQPHSGRIRSGRALSTRPTHPCPCPTEPAHTPAPAGPAHPSLCLPSTWSSPSVSGESCGLSPKPAPLPPAPRPLSPSSLPPAPD